MHQIKNSPAINPFLSTVSPVMNVVNILGFFMLYKEDFDLRVWASLDEILKCDHSSLRRRRNMTVGNTK